MAEKVRFGLIGCGGMMRHHLGTMTRDESIEIVGLADPSPEQLTRCCTQYPGLEGVKSYSDYQEMIERDDIDAVLLSTPHTQHADQMIECFGKGLHVLCEKPLVTSVADAHRVIQARDKAGKIGAIAYQRHGVAPFQYIREKVLDGTYGSVRGMNSHNSQSWLTGTRGSWRQDPSLSGGGQLNDTGSHVVDILLYVSDLRARKVQAFIENRGAPVDIDSVVNIQFDKEAIGNITIMGSGVVWHERHHLWFEKAFMLLQNDRLEVFEESGRHFAFEGWPKNRQPVENFVDAVLGKADVLAPFECGLRVIELTEAAWKSAEQGGQTITVE